MKIARIALFVAAALVATAFGADISNPQYSLLALLADRYIVVIEGTIDANSLASLKAKFEPVKKQIKDMLASGKAMPNGVIDLINGFYATADKEARGFSTAVENGVSSNKVAAYNTISNTDPASSWNFLYYAYQATAVKVESPEIEKLLKELDGKIDAELKGAASSATIVKYIDAFFAQAEKIKPGFQDEALMFADSMITDFKRISSDAQGKAAVPTSSPLPTFAPDAAKPDASSSNATEPEPETPSTTEGSEASAATDLTTAPVATKAAATTVPTAKPSSGASMLSVATAAVMAAATLALTM